MKRMFVIVGIMLVIAMAGLALAACADVNGGSSSAGGSDETYYEVKWDGAIFALDESFWIKLGGGKWSDNDGESGTYMLDGDRITILQEGVELASGTLKNGTLELGMPGSPMGTYRTRGAQESFLNSNPTPSSDPEPEDTPSSENGSSNDDPANPGEEGEAPATLEYTVVFDGNGGALSGDRTQTVSKGDRISKPTDPVYPAHIFIGWSKTIAENNFWDFTSDSVAADITLYAVWEEEIIVSFNANGGQFSSGEKTLTSTVDKGNKVSIPETPTRENYRFTSWFADSRLTARWDFDNDSVVASITLYAGWAYDEKDITFVLNYAGAKDVVKKTADGKIDYTPERDGYVFNGWWLSSGSTSDGYILSKKYDTTKVVTQSGLTLYAEWVDEATMASQLSAPSVGIEDGVFSWTAIPGAQSYGIIISKSGSSAELSRETINRTSWSFPDSSYEAGYYNVRIRANGDGINAVNSVYVTKSYANRILPSVTDISLDISTSVLTWSALNHPATYYVYLNNQLEETTSETVFDLSSYNAGNYSLKIEAQYGNYAKSTSTASIKKYRLKSPLFQEEIQSDGTYHFSWEPVFDADTYIITINGHDERTSDTSYDFTPSMWGDATELTISIAAFDSNADYLISLSNQTETIEDRPYVIQVVTEGEGGTATAPLFAFKDDEVTLVAETNAGYTWVGWFDGEEKVSEGTSLTYTFAMPAEDKAYAAKWSKVMIDQNDNSAGTVTALTDKYNVGDEVSVTASTSSGYTWLGWYDGEEKVSEETNLTYTFAMPAETKTYIAKWISCPVALTKNVDEAGSVDGLEGATVVGESATITASTNSGYTWLGWYDGEEKVSEGTSLTYTFTMSMEEKVYTAKWSKVTIDRNDDSAGTVTALTEKYNVGDEVTLVATTNGGYTWLGWYDGDEKVSDEMSLTYTFIMSTEDKVYTAKWDVLEELKNYEFVSTEEGCVIKRVKDKSVSTAIIPACVIKIDTSAFEGWEALKSITIEDGVKSIGQGAFYRCIGLTSISIPLSVKSLGEAVFDECINLMSITIPESVTSIEKGLFFGCSGLKAVTIPESVISIEDSAFYGCSSLTSITIPDSVMSIGENAFSHCSALAEITIPFVGSRKNANIASDLTLFGYLFGTKSYTGGSAVEQYYDTSAKKVYYIPSSLCSVTVKGGDIFYGAFCGCSMLTSITIPEDVTSIPSHAFYDCRGLTSITIPENNVTRIKAYAFYNCISLTSITIPESVESIEEGAFGACYKLMEVYNQSTISIRVGSYDNGSVGYYAKAIYTSDYVSKLSTDENGYLLYTDDDLVCLVGYNGADATLAFPSGVTEIYQYAFCGCSGLASITIPESVTSIGDSAFAGCISLTSVTIPESVIYIGRSVFHGCSGLISIEIPFIGAKNGGASYEYFGSIFGAGSYRENSSCVPSSLRTVMITGGTSIEQFAFYGCSRLISISIPESVESIEERAFANCSRLTSITIPESVTSIGVSAFSNCYNLVEVYNQSALSITVGSTDNGNVGYYAKEVYTSNYVSKLSTDESGYILYTADDGVSLIGYIGSDTNLTLPAEITEINQYAFYSFSKIISIVIPESVTSIGSYAFAYCSGLTSITIGENVTSIGDYAFYYCSGLTSITIPSSVTSIGGRAFTACSLLTSITVPKNLMSIGDYAFSSCNKLTSIIFHGEKEMWYAISKGSYWITNVRYTIHCLDGDILKSI